MIRAWWDRGLVAVVSLLGLFPFARGLSEGEIPGQENVPLDGAHTIFVYEYVRQALLGHVSLLHADAMWYPLGRPFLLGIQNVVDAFLAAPFLGALGVQHGMAAFVALVLVSNGLAAGWMGERIGGRGLAGPLAACVVAFAPYAWCETQMGRPTQAMLSPMCLALGHAWTAADDAESRLRPALWSGCWLVVAALEYWFYGFFGCILVGGVYLGALLGRGRRHTLRALAITALLPALCAAPFALYVASTWTEMPGASMSSPVPNSTRLWAGLPGRNSLRTAMYVPQLLYAVALLPLFTRQRWRAGGLALAMLFLVGVAVGERVDIGPFEGVRTPLALLRELPGFHRFWWPHRALGAVVVGAAAAAAACVAAGGLPRLLATLGIALSAGQALQTPGELTSWKAPRRPLWDEALPPGAVLLLPMLDPDAGKHFLAQWAVHHRPMVNGMSMWDDFLWPQDFEQWVTEQPLLDALLAIERSRPYGRRAAEPNVLASPNGGARAPAVKREVAIRRAEQLDADDLQAFADLGVVGIVAHLARTPPEAVATITRLAGDPSNKGDFAWWPLPAPR
ncbi:MAG: hypothetical protein FJ090_17385 [Deltaproteobacteria bacterium]|nr:hypothetical protein [Deltaproteobacteria bacterium]